MAKFPALQPETPENDVTVQEENIFAPVKRRPQYFLGAVLVACILMLFCTPLPDQLILFPTTQRIDAHGAVRETIPFQNGELEIWTARSRLAQQRNRVDAYILRFYGNADRAERWVALEADAFGERAIGIWGMNYPGFGGSSGPARLKRMSPAGLAAFNALKSKAGNHPIVVFGASIGSAVAMDVAANRSVRGLILHNPTPLRQIILRHYGWWNLWLLAGPVALQIPRELDSVANANRIHAPALFLLAENDEIVPPKFQRLVVDSFAGEKQVIILPGAHHNSPIEGAVVAEIHRAYDWLFDATATNEM
jgi:pimeloyl-ACP methyl ester carboxylesterase